MREMKTPEEIKKGLETCIKAPFNNCDGCSYTDAECPRCVENLCNDAIAYIQRLENDVSACERAFSQLGDGGVVRREFDHQRELMEKNVEMRRLEEAYHKLEAQVPKWISVEERLPEVGEKVLVFNDGNMFVAEFKRNSLFEDGYGYSHYFDGDTCWMPLPDAPEEDETCQS